MATRLLPPGYQILDANGRPYSGALLYTYEAGTSTPKPTYSDGGATIANANPVQADSAGRFGNLFAEVGDYALDMRTSAGVPIYTADPVAGASSSATLPGAGWRNLLVNGDFSFNQRGATTAADDAYCLDAWYVLAESGSATVAQQSLQAAGIPTNIRLTQPDAVAKRMGLAQIVEAGNCRFARDSSVVLSGKIRHSLAAPIRYAILSWTGTADTVTSDVVLDWASASYTAGGFFLAANLTVQAVGSITPTAGTWTSITPITATVSASMNNLIVMFWTEAATAQNATLDIANVQIEQGNEDSAFEYLPRDTVASRCFRYYQKSFSLTTAPAQNTEPATATRFTQCVGAAGGQAGMTVWLRQMRNATITVTTYNPSAANAEMRNNTTGTDCSATGATQTGDSRFSIITTTPAGSAVGNTLAIHWTAEASL